MKKVIEQEEVVRPKQYVLKKDIVIPKGTILEHSDGVAVHMISGMYMAVLQDVDGLAFAIINDDVLLTDKKFMAEVK